MAGTPFNPNNPVNPKDVPSKTDNSKNITNPVNSVLGSFSALTRPAFWSRVGVFALGVVLVWAGILVLIASNKNVQQLAGGAVKGALAKTPQGVAANLATGALA
jgi:hypothetical protein